MSNGFNTFYNPAFKIQNALFAEYQQIISPVYTFNIEVIEGDGDNSTGDDIIGSTISEVFHLFFSKIDNVTTYVCDSPVAGGEGHQI